MTWKSTAIVTGATALVGWLASPLPHAPAQNTIAPSARTAERAASASDIEQQAERLRARLRAEAIFREPSRDPFRFASRSVQAGSRTNSSQNSGPLDKIDQTPVVQAPLVTLSGIASDVIDGVMRRTGILSAPEGVLLVREGDLVGGLYRVGTIDEETVDLIRVADGGLFRLRLASPRP